MDGEIPLGSMMMLEWWSLPGNTIGEDLYNDSNGDDLATIITRRGNTFVVM